MFKAKGKLISMKGKIISAVMHDGFLGSEHQVKLMLDDKFFREVVKTLNAKYKLEQKPGQIFKTQRYFGDKGIKEHEIEIIIK